MRRRTDTFVATALSGIFLAALALGSAGQGIGGIPVSLRVEGGTETFFEGMVTVSDCTVTDTEGNDHALSRVAACALAEAADDAGLTADYQDFGFGLFLKRIGSDDTPADFAQSWAFWVHDDPASVGVDAYTVHEDDRILLAFTSFPGVPLRVTTPETVAVGEGATFVVEKRVGAYDESFVWHGRWEPAEGAALHVNGDTHAVPLSGQVAVTFETPGAHTVFADGEGFIRSATAAVGVPEASPSPSPTTPPSPSPTPIPPPGPTPTTSPLPTPAVPPSRETRTRAAADALAYLRGRQSPDGSIEGTISTAWSAMAFGAHGERARDTYGNGSSLLDALSRASLQSATDLERQILALRASGEDPRLFGGRDLVRELTERFRNGQIGEEDLINDDIFGILALLAAGQSVSAPDVHQTVGTLLSRQSADGSWEGVDLTAAAIQALRAYADRGGAADTTAAVHRARQYLTGTQDVHGGFGENSASTAWAIQAIVALGEDPAAWRNTDGKTPWDAMLRYQNANGGFGWKSRDDVSAFMTAYAVPALLEIPWPITILEIQTAPTPTPRETAIAPATASPRIAGAHTQPADGGTRPRATTPERRDVAGAPTDRAGETAGAASESTSAEEDAPAAFSPPGEFWPLTATDRRFALAMFSVTNLGIGAALGRLFGKLRPPT